ncbi:MAG: D-glycero-beta-D-manno-heptose 1-phosphate adenylyltransferase [Proteobacteria bacterium]|nr:D-glycero-beta-D-manno-heptose 1-phosphate adenylyltransferase [Pseudomonadota bacterium]MBU1737976.1 D-glycero-beta-D-manno-heptose 1-phosphate adenylyltransferase [Pseudomonadota bacterium]
MQKCRGGFIQFDVRLGDSGHNLARVRAALAGLKGDEPAVVVLPELWAAGFDYPGLAGHAAENGRILEIMQELAAEQDLYLVGSIPESAETPGGPAIHNTLYIVGPAGVLGKMRKQQLFAPMGEADYFTPGDEPRAVSTTLGVLGGLVCFDLRFPDLARSQTAEGAGLLVVSGQWPAARREHWRTLLRARAIENQVFVIGCNRCGTTDNTEFGGHSMIVAPDGTVLAEAGIDPATILVDLDPALLSRSRRLFTSVAPAPYRFHDGGKITTLAELKPVITRYKAMGRRVVFTNGCFDILHRGHVTYLEEARRLGDCLVVGLNNDASVRMLNKSPERPYNDEQSRARVLAALGCVDHVVLFAEDTPLKLIMELMPDVLVKGGDWPVSQIVGAAEVVAAGGKVLSIPLVDNFSTTSLIERIRE